jgi:hypothetical protein
VDTTGRDPGSIGDLVHRIWISYEARRKHQPRDPNSKTSSDPSLIE